MQKKLIAELIGTFVLCLVVLLASNASNFIVPVPVMAGLTVGLFVYTIGSLSGCHLNPAVTIGILSLGKIGNFEAAKYISAQVIGAVFALATVSVLVITTPSSVSLIGNITIIPGEIIGAAILTLGIASVVYGKISDASIGIVIGGSLVLGALVAGLMDAPGFLNPAVAFASKSISLSTIFAPVMGGVLGMQIYKYLINKN